MRRRLRTTRSTVAAFLSQLVDFPRSCQLCSYRGAPTLPHPPRPQPNPTSQQCGSSTQEQRTSSSSKITSKAHTRFPPTHGAPNEVSFEQYPRKPNTAGTGWDGLAKINKTCELALGRSLNYAWVDTCFNDKSSKLSEATNYMFRWCTDAAPSVSGIFDIHMPMTYSEGAKAWFRLRGEIAKQSCDLSLFTWTVGRAVFSKWILLSCHKERVTNRQSPTRM